MNLKSFPVQTQSRCDSQLASVAFNKHCLLADLADGSHSRLGSWMVYHKHLSLQFSSATMVRIGRKETVFSISYATLCNERPQLFLCHSGTSSPCESTTLASVSRLPGEADPPIPAMFIGSADQRVLQARGPLTKRDFATRFLALPTVIVASSLLLQ